MHHSILPNTKLIYLLFENWHLLINHGEATSQIELIEYSTPIWL
jgi:hypothetical protein